MGETVTRNRDLSMPSAKVRHFMATWWKRNSTGKCRTASERTVDRLELDALFHDLSRPDQILVLTDPTWCLK